jgi:hypothetical protein
MWRTVGRGTAVDPRWSVPAQLLSSLRLGRRLAPADSPLGLPDILSSPVYRDLSTPSVAVGDDAVDFELPALDGGGTVRLSSFKGDKPVALVFGSYT